MNPTSSRMDIDSVLAALGISAAAPILAPHWESSGASLLPGLPPFLSAEAISRTRLLARLPQEANPVLHETARQIVASPPLLQLAWHCQRLLCQHLDYGVAEIRQWPVLTAALGELSGAFYLLVGLAAIPHIQAIHKKLDIPRPISLDTCGRLYPEIVGRYRDHHAGQFGVWPGTVYWLRNYICGDLYTLGRLEYMIRPFRGAVRAFRHRGTRAVVALAADGSLFDGEGLAVRSEAANTWRAELWQGDGRVCGFPVSPHGHAVQREIALPLEEWDQALSPGEAMLEVHIPGGGQMTPASCGASMRQAREFFPRYFPHKTFAGFSCGSWILNPQLAQIYRPDSNMVLWQRELYLYPIPSGDRSGLVFVFGKDDIDLDTAPRDTSLRRALLDHMAAGGRLIGGGMFSLDEDFAHFGNQVYRRHWRESGIASH